MSGAIGGVEDAAALTGGAEFRATMAPPPTSPLTAHNPAKTAMMEKPSFMEANRCI